MVNVDGALKPETAVSGPNIDAATYFTGLSASVSICPPDVPGAKEHRLKCTVPKLANGAPA